MAGRKHLCMFPSLVREICRCGSHGYAWCKRPCNNKMEGYFWPIAVGLVCKSHHGNNSWRIPSCRSIEELNLQEPNEVHTGKSQWRCLWLWMGRKIKNGSILGKEACITVMANSFIKLSPPCFTLNKEITSCSCPIRKRESLYPRILSPILKTTASYNYHVAWVVHKHFPPVAALWPPVCDT